MAPQLSVNPDVVCSPLGDGGVLLDLTTKQYFALNATGLAAWQFLEDGGSLEALAAAVRQTGLAPDPGLTQFARTLVDHGLAEAGSATALINGETPLPPMPASWQAPSLTPHGRPLAEVILSPFDPTVPVPE